VESGGGSSSQDGIVGRTPPDEEQMRLGRARVARGLDIAGEGRAPNGSTAASAFAGPGSPNDASLDPGNRPSAAGDAQADAIDLGPRFRPWSEAGPAAQGPMRCPFLRIIGPDGRLGEAQKTAVPAHRCAAFGDPLPLSLRQQELVCLQRVHVSCPRYVRGTLLANESQSEEAPGERRSGGVPILTVAGVGLVILALAILFTGLLGLPPFGSGGPTQSAAVVAAGSESPSTTASPKRTAAPTATPTATLAATASPAARTSPTLTPTPAVTPPWPAGWDAPQRAVLVPCTDQANCWWYTVRGPGPAPSGNGSSVPDNIAAIARWFKVDLNQIYTLNGWTSSHVIHVGDRIRIPPPVG
jgi:hypothetical protein